MSEGVVQNLSTSSAGAGSARGLEPISQMGLRAMREQSYLLGLLGKPGCCTQRGTS